MARVVFAGLAFGIWAGAESYGERLAALQAIMLSLTASAFCAAVALGWIGKHKAAEGSRGNMEE